MIDVGSKLVSIFSIFILTLLSIVTLSIIVSDYEMDRCIKVVDDFSESISVTGYISKEQYANFVKSMPMSDIRINMMHIKNGEKNEKHPTAVDAVFTQDILSVVVDKGIYNEFEIGDVYKIDVYKLSRSPFEVVLGVITGNWGGAIQKVASRSPAISDKKIENTNKSEVGSN